MAKIYLALEHQDVLDSSMVYGTYRGARYTEEQYFDWIDDRWKLRGKTDEEVRTVLLAAGWIVFEEKYDGT